MTFIFPKNLRLIPIFIKIATLKVLLKGKKTNECTSNTSVLFYFMTGSYLYGIHPLPDTHERSFVGTVVQQEDTVRPTEVRLGYASKSVNRTKSLLVEKVRAY